MLTHTIIGILEIILNFASLLIFIQVVLSLLISFNVVNRHNGLVAGTDNALNQLFEPVYRPLRRIIPATSGIDWAPMLALLVIRILLYILGNLDAAMLMNGGAM